MNVHKYKWVKEIKGEKTLINYVLVSRIFGESYIKIKNLDIGKEGEGMRKEVVIRAGELGKQEIERQLKKGNWWWKGERWGCGGGVNSF